MKFLLCTPALLLCLLSLSGCGSGNETTVNPAPEISQEELLKMDEESDKARQEAIRDGM
ncbi:hypothetical protein [Allorhodopirellula heiligendammensis]|uniref:Secreted protein n=1 Tax=Allorhodopirellula heiligendammensis TaxID=2714739 RepID=A0A5C6C7G1_9BACT|nr:hypothetical protein [Allorhodopirellula heiligendammensis]TWU19254.1 hypothetical protein Poly21_14260 [Allorhodopirellula heiligendammensis]|tara:strand:- start:3211 stop:3387 length:177 start_codon:yes stop_codon:yes gene_type:complete